jgi:glucosamine 6-phosphate synthetase-like amidotransferase/phosphosugar isomerase protein
MMLVGNNLGDIVAAERSLVFPIAYVPAFLSPILELVPAQVLAYRLAERQGYDPGTVRYLSKVITSETGVPSQETSEVDNVTN